MSHYVYIPVGSTNQLLVLAMHPDSGCLTRSSEVALGKRGSAVCADPSRRHLYVALEQEGTYAIASFAIDQRSGALTSTGEVEVEASPCYLSTDRKGRFLLAAYYSAGLVTVHRIGVGGDLEGPSVCCYETKPFAHYVATDNSNRFAFVPHVAGTNAIYQFNFDQETGQLTPNESVPVLACGVDEGPRHLAFHPTLDVVYSDNEQGSSVTVYRFDTNDGLLEAIQTVSTLPLGNWEGNTNAQLHIHPRGKFIYASNRGHDSIAMFAIDAQTGLITSLGQEPAEKVPRAFGIDAAGRFLFSGADGSQILRSFRITRDGALESIGATLDLGGTAGWVYTLSLG